jgi:UDP-glucose 4-epimerase
VAGSKSVLITGAAGFIGSHLSERCLSRGWSVLAVDAFTDYYDVRQKRTNIGEIREHANFQLVEDDLLELNLDDLLQDVSAVFHLAAQPGVRSSWDQFDLYTQRNLTATQRLLRAATGATLDRFVIASSSSVYGDAERLPTPEDTALQPVSPYGLTKVATENLAQVYRRNFGVPTVCLRYFTVFGPRQRPDMAFHRLIASALAGQPFEVYGDGQQTRDFTYIRDAVDGTVEAALRGRPGAVYNIGGGGRRSLNSVLDAVGTLLGEPVKRVEREPQRGDARATGADTERARRDLGFHPAHTFEAGLEAQLEWQRATLGATFTSNESRAT